MNFTNKKERQQFITRTVIEVLRRAAMTGDRPKVIVIKASPSGDVCINSFASLDDFDTVALRNSDLDGLSRIHAALARMPGGLGVYFLADGQGSSVCVFPLKAELKEDSCH